MASVGTSCLIRVIWRDAVYVANMGDSQAVLSSIGSPPLSNSGSMQAYPLSLVHDLIKLPDAHISDFTNGNDGLQLIKDIIQVSRSIRDAYLNTWNLHFQIYPSRKLLAYGITFPLKKLLSLFALILPRDCKATCVGSTKEGC
ncbi:putative protein phosphatase 2C 63 [Bienertia sinuspersici]